MPTNPLLHRLAQLRKKLNNKLDAPAGRQHVSVTHTSKKSLSNDDSKQLSIVRPRASTISFPPPSRPDPATSIYPSPSDVKYFETLFEQQVTHFLNFCHSYTPLQKFTVLALAKRYIAPYLGPAPTVDPTTGGLVCPFPSYMCDDHSPIEYSIKFSQGEPMEVRFSVEPLSASCTNEDNLRITEKLLQDIAEVATEGFDPAPFEKLKSCIADANSRGRDGTPADQKFTQMMVALDFGGSGITVKGYCVSVLADLANPTGNIRQIGEFAG
ncbi:hypothetical protein HK097_003998, partial [Rhizophlyctis rosea]